MESPKRNNPLTRKIEIPICDGENAKSWAMKVEQYFELSDFTEGEKLRVVGRCFDGEALTWYRWESDRTHFHSWEQMKHRFLEKFATKQDLTPGERIEKMLQKLSKMEERWEKMITLREERQSSVTGESINIRNQSPPTNQSEARDRVEEGSETKERVAQMAESENCFPLVLHEKSVQGKQMSEKVGTREDESCFLLLLQEKSVQGKQIGEKVGTSVDKTSHSCQVFEKMTKRRKKKKRHKEISLKRDRNFVEGFATSKYRNVQIGFPQRLEGQLNHEEQTTEPKQTDVDMAKHACQVFDHMPIREKGKSKKKKKRRWKNLSKNNKRDSKGKRKSVWHLDCEVEFWKHRCIKTRTFSKMETLKSLLKKKPADAKTNISFETPQASNPMLSRLYLADNSVFPRYDHLKPLLALKETRNSQSNTKPTKAEKTLPKISDAKWNNSKAVGSKLNSGNKQLDGQPNLTSSNSKEIFEKPDELKGMVMRNRDTHRESVKRAIKGQRGRRARKRSHGKLRRWKYKPGKCFILVSYIPPLLEGGGKLEVWDVDGKAKTPLPKEDMGKLYSGDCYLVLYTYHSGERKDEYFLCCWFGKRSIQKDQVTEIRLANAMSNSLKVRHVQGHIYEGKEPPQFVAFFQPMMVLHGGLSSRYKNIIEENGLQDKTYTPESMALIQVSGTGVHNNKAVPVELVATSLNSYECFLRKSGTSMFPWHGNQSAHEQLELAAKVAEVLKSGITLKHAKEGTESSTFWSAFGEKQNFICKKASSETVRDPHLFSFSFNIGKFQVEEIHNFAQDDLLTEDIYLLDTHAEVFVWVGQRVDPKEKQTVFEIGQKYVDLTGSLEGLSPKVPLYKVNEGNEPCFFTTDFSWDHTKAIVQGNSFQKNSVMLFGTHYVGEEKSNSGNQGPRQRGEALAALKSAFNSSGSRTTYLSQDRPNKSQEGPRQRAEAFAALLSAFKWKDQPDYDCSWEWKSKMKDHFTLEDKVGFKGEGIDTSEAKCPPILYQY